MRAKRGREEVFVGGVSVRERERCGEAWGDGKEVIWFKKETFYFHHQERRTHAVGKETPEGVFF